MKIKHIKIKNFKSIKEMNLELRDINVLIGANGAGKSNLISFLKLLNHVIEGELQNYVRQSGGAYNLLYFGTKTSTHIEAEIDFSPNHYYCELRPTEDDTLFFAKETVYFDTTYRYGERLGTGHKETNLFEKIRKGSGVAQYVANAFKSWKVYHFHDTSSTARVKSPCDVNDNRFLRPDASNLAAFLYRLQQRNQDNFEQIEYTVRLIAPFFDRFKLEPLALDESKIQLEWKHVGSDQYFNAHGLSDGTLRMICLSTLLLQPNLPDTIIIDEPELGLHPSAIQILASLIESASLKTQTIISTQSVTLINHFEPDDIVVVERENHHSVFKRLDAESLSTWLEDYSLGEMWEKNIIGGRP